MKKITVFILLLVLLISVSFAQETKGKSLKNYANDLYSFKYDPLAWSFAQEGDEARTCTLKYKFVEQPIALDAETGFFLKANKFKDPPDINEIKKNIKEVEAESWSNVEIISVKDIKNNGAVGIEIIFTSEMQDKKYKVVQHLYRKDKNFYMFTAVAIQNEFDKAKPFLDEVIKTYVIK